MSSKNIVSEQSETTGMNQKVAKKSSRLVITEPSKDGSERGSKGKATLQDIIDYQAVDLNLRMAHITYADLEKAGALLESSSASEAEKQRAMMRNTVVCCGAKYQYDVSDEFDDPAFRAQFMSKTLFLMACTLVAPLLWCTYALFNEPTRFHFYIGYKLHGMISGSCLLGFNIAVGRMRRGSKVVVYVILIFRSVALASTLSALNMFTELVLIDIAFEPYIHDYDPKQEEYFKIQNINNPITTTTMKVLTSTHYLQQYVHSLAILWIVAMLVIFLSWVIMAIVLKFMNTKKIDPNGVWMFGLGITFALLAASVQFVVVIMLEFGKGPKLWDLSQVSIACIIAIIVSVWLPIRWRRLFEGRTIDLEPDDHIDVAASKATINSCDKTSRKLFRLLSILGPGQNLRVGFDYLKCLTRKLELGINTMNNISKGDKGPYTPSYPSVHHVEYGIVEFQQQDESKHKLFVERESTIIGVLEQEITERKAIEEKLESANRVIEEHEYANAKRTNPGFWIFGSGHRHEMPEEFKNPDLSSKFIIKIMSIMVINSLLRGLVLCLVLLYKPFHDKMYASEVYKYPFLTTLAIYVLFVLITQSQAFNLFVRRHHFHGILFLFSEILLGVLLCFAAILIEYAVIEWYNALDIFHDYEEHDEDSRHHWSQVRLTPPIVLILLDFQIAINIIAALLLQSFTPIHIGAHELYRIMIWLTVFTLGISYMMMLTSSYGVLSIYDALQILVGCLGGLGKSWVFAYKLVSLVAGKLVHVESMSWNDVFYGAYITF